jgi:hypothetical protein
LPSYELPRVECLAKHSVPWYETLYIPKVFSLLVPSLRIVVLYSRVPIWHGCMLTGLVRDHAIGGDGCLTGD